MRKADSLVGTRGLTGNIRSFEGHVQFSQGNVFVTSDKAIQYLDENRAELVGNVVVTQEDMVLKSPKIDWEGNSGLVYAVQGVVVKDNNQLLKAKKGIYSTRTYIADFEEDVLMTDDTVNINCDKIQYHRKTRKSYLWGNVIVKDDSSALEADYAEYHRITREAYAYGNVVAYGLFTRVYLSGDTIFTIPEKQYMVARGKPVMNQVDSVEKKGKHYIMDDKKKITMLDSTWFEYDTTSITAKTMEQIKSGEEVYLFRDSVRIARKNLCASSENASFFKTKDYIVLQGNPVVWYDSTQLHSDSIVIWMEKNKLKELHSYGNSLAATKEDSLNPERINQIIGNEIVIRFAEDTIRAVFSWGNAKSLYFMTGENGSEGAARNSSDSIYIEFQKGETENIHWLGGIQGEFFPEVIIASPKDYYLPGYRWNDSKPVFVLSNFFIKLKAKEDALRQKRDETDTEDDEY